MADKRTILIQLDTDPLPSVFDRIVALDAGADEVLSYGGVTPEQVRGIVHGAIFTRGATDLKRTAIFIGGSNVAAAERLLDEVQQHMIPQFGLRMSVMLDPNGSNTTAAAAVSAARMSLELKGSKALVLGTGPVGRRVALLLAHSGADVRIGSPELDWAEEAAAQLDARVKGSHTEATITATPRYLERALRGQTIVISAGPAGAEILDKATRAGAADLKLAIDLNAAPPLGIEGIEVTDQGVSRDGIVAYGALAIGKLKMKIHKASIARLFEESDRVMDAREIDEMAMVY